jgi:hypothetical protein
MNSAVSVIRKVFALYSKFGLRATIWEFPRKSDFFGLRNKDAKENVV